MSEKFLIAPFILPLGIALTTISNATEPFSEMDPLYVEEDSAVFLESPSRWLNASLSLNSKTTPLAGIPDRSFSMIPGLWVASGFGDMDQPRISLRGSGLNNFPTNRGFCALWKYVPLNFADGSLMGSFLNPNAFERFSAHVGADAYIASAASLGGILQFSNEIPTNHLWMEANSQGYYHAGLAYNLDDHWGVRLYGGQGEGEREFNSYSNAGGSLVFQDDTGDIWSHELEFRWDYSSFDVPGPLNRIDVAEEPDSVSPGLVVEPGSPPSIINAGPDILRDQPHRITRQYRIQYNAIRRDGDEEPFSIHSGVAYVDDFFRRPRSQGIESSIYRDAFLAADYIKCWDMNGIEGKTTLKSSQQYGTRSSRFYHNMNGVQGELFADNRFDALSSEYLMDHRLKMGSFILDLSLTYAHTQREITDNFDSSLDYRPDYGALDYLFENTDTSADFSYDAILPRLALAWELSPKTTLSMSYYQRMEAPIFDDLFSISAANPNQGPNAININELAAQESENYELEWAYQDSDFAGGIILYHSVVDHELISVYEGSNIVTTNATSPVDHDGLELYSAYSGIDNLRLSWLLECFDYHFDDNDTYGDNELVLIPEWRLGLDAVYALTQNWDLKLWIQHIDGDIPVDYANTQFCEGYTLVDIGAGYQFSKTWNVTLTVFNLFDENYVATALPRALVPAAAYDAQANFIPGSERAYQLSLNATW